MNWSGHLSQPTQYEHAREVCSTACVEAGPSLQPRQYEQASKEWSTLNVRMQV
jgi:hypothetical protein